MNSSLTHLYNRRNFLKGAGLSLALPFLESGASPALAAVKPVRTKRILAVGNHLGFYPGAFFPKEAGSDYLSSPTLRNIEKHRKDFTVFSHLDHDVGGGHGGVNAFLSGVRKQESKGFPEKNVSIDQIAAEHVGSVSRFPSITAGIGGGDGYVLDTNWSTDSTGEQPVSPFQRSLRPISTIRTQHRA